MTRRTATAVIALLLAGENAPPETISEATFASNTLTLEYYHRDKLGTFTR